MINTMMMRRCVQIRRLVWAKHLLWTDCFRATLTTITDTTVVWQLRRVMRALSGPSSKNQSPSRSFRSLAYLITPQVRRQAGVRWRQLQQIYNFLAADFIVEEGRKKCCCTFANGCNVTKRAGECPQIWFSLVHAMWPAKWSITQLRIVRFRWNLTQSLITVSYTHLTLPTNREV